MGFTFNFSARSLTVTTSGTRTFGRAAGRGGRKSRLCACAVAVAVALAAGEGGMEPASPYVEALAAPPSLSGVGGGIL